MKSTNSTICPIALEPYWYIKPVTLWIRPMLKQAKCYQAVLSVTIFSLFG